MNEYKADIFSLKDISEIDSTDIIEKNFKYNIPIYQRLFVWGYEQIQTFLDDLFRAYIMSKKSNGNANYYIGAVVVAKRGENYELIDGQQRFTMMWLISSVINHIKNNEELNHLEKFAFIGEELRLSFSIRDGVKEFFELLRKNEFVENSKEIDDIDNICEAFTQIKNYFNDSFNKNENILKIDREELISLTEFLYTKMTFNLIQVPAKANLNKLFEIINARGLQLEQHEILKAKFRKYLPDNERLMQLWNACSDMTDYFENNVKFQSDIEGLTWHVLLDMMSERSDEKDDEDGSKSSILKYSKEFVKNYCNYNINDGDNANNGIQILRQTNDNSKSILEVLTAPVEEEYDSKFKTKNNAESIISFNLLLLHTLRIFLFENGKEDIDEIDEKKLLTTFNECFFKPYKNELKCFSIDFIKTLVHVRMVFDQFIIKRVNSEDGIYHQILTLKKVRNKDGNYERDRYKYKSDDTISMLQSMLYHSQAKPHYWLTPYLYCLKNDYKGSKVLETIDNYFFCSNKDSNLTYKLKGRECMVALPKLTNENFSSFLFKLKNENNTDYRLFGKYSFYKTEYILWLNREKLFDIHNDLYTEEYKKIWNDYKFSFKNSVEHIYPQSQPNSENGALKDNLLHDFGNLVLITTGINSSYGKKPINEKREIFKNKLATNRIDSLKSFIFFLLNEWDNDAPSLEKIENCIKNHKNKVVEYIEEYFNTQNNE
ncbi:MAG: DUF262 domain-containing HNH endonuclease family protein [Bacteroidales bacterium]|nr:DUF262 domain-containing HNH endonuclease family protein [Bacteroidales bacterium]